MCCPFFDTHTKENLIIKRKNVIHGKLLLDFCNVKFNLREQDERNSCRTKRTKEIVVWEIKEITQPTE